METYGYNTRRLGVLASHPILRFCWASGLPELYWNGSLPRKTSALWTAFSPREVNSLRSRASL